MNTCKLLVHIIVHFWELFVNCFAKSAQAADGEFVDTTVDQLTQQLISGRKFGIHLFFKIDALVLLFAK
jgi:hypothetical protein